MVNETALQKAIKFFETQNISQMKKWSDRSRYERNTMQLLRNVREKVADIRKILIIFSGNDIGEMLKGCIELMNLNSNDVLTEEERDFLSLPQYKQSLQNLTETYHKTSLKERFKMARPLKTAVLKYRQVRRLGFKISRPLWRGCNDQTPRKLGGNSLLSLSLQYGIESYLHANSSIASNRLVKIRNKNSPQYNEYIPARYLNDNKTETFKKSPFNNLVSKSTFLKYLNSNNEFKNPHRLTDLCEYCEREIVFKKQLAKFVKDENYEDNELFDLAKLKKDAFEKARIVGSDLNNQNLTNDVRENLKARLSTLKSILETMRDYEVLIFHKNVARCQRMAYNVHHKNTEFLNNKILIEIDFKQKICIGMSPRQVNSEYYNQVLRSCLGFGVYFVGDDSKIKSINFDIISSDLSQGAYSVVRGMRILRQQDFFKNIEKQNYVIWSDTGKHFRNNEVLGYFLSELKQENIHVNINFFAEKHGKNGRDAHFSNIAKFIKAESLVRRLTTSQDIVDAIITRQRMANENKKEPKENVTTIAMALDSETDHRIFEEFQNNNFLTVANLESFYNYRTFGENFELMTSVLSNNDHLKKLEHLNENKKNQYVVVNEVPVIESSVHFVTMHSKKQRISAALLQIKENIDEISPSFTEILNVFTTRIEQNEVVTNSLKPQYCRETTEATALKPACQSCTASCSYTLEDILSQTHGIGQKDLLAELTVHKHPKTRKMPNFKLRNTSEAARELADHYIYAHNMREPERI